MSEPTDEDEAVEREARQLWKAITDVLDGRSESQVGPVIIAALRATAERVRTACLHRPAWLPTGITDSAACRHCGATIDLRDVLFVRDQLYTEIHGAGGLTERLAHANRDALLEAAKKLEQDRTVLDPTGGSTGNAYGTWRQIVVWLRELAQEEG